MMTDDQVGQQEKGVHKDMMVADNEVICK